MPRVREVVNEVHEANRVNIKAALGRVAISTRTALQFQDLRARLNKEIGQGSDAGGPVVVPIVFMTNVNPMKLAAARSRALPLPPALLRTARKQRSG